jgi:hypothetical protein
MAPGPVEDVLGQADVRKRPLEVHNPEAEQKEAVIEVRVQ